MAHIERLEPYTYIAFTDKYAKAYGQLPRVVNAERFDDVMPMLLLWKEQNEFSERYLEAEKKLKNPLGK